MTTCTKCGREQMLSGGIYDSTEGMCRARYGSASDAADGIAARTPIPLPNGMERYEGSTTRWVLSEKAKAVLARAKDILKARGEITSRQFPQMRTGKPKRGKRRG